MKLQLSLACVLLTLLATVTTDAHAQLRQRAVTGRDLQKYSNGILSLMGYTVAPDVTTSSLSITDASTENPHLSMTQFGGGFVISDSVPIYLEGNAAYSRYDPVFILSDGQEDRVVPAKWNAVSATGGIGYDFALTPKWSIRPIFNLTLGYVASDLRAAQGLINFKTNSDFDFVDHGQLNAYGVGGSLMLVYKDHKPEREIDFEGRYTNVGLHSYDSSDAVKGQAKAESVILWGRVRVPTGLTAMQRPVRWVFELAHSNYFDENVAALGLDSLTSFGLGMELDSSAYPIWVTRWRAVIRHVVGNNVSGWSLGLAVSF